MSADDLTDASLGSSLQNKLQIGSASPATTRPEGTEINEVDEGPSLMDEMMRAANEALEAEAKTKRETAAKQAKSFSGGLKSGFLNNKPKRAAAAQRVAGPATAGASAPASKPTAIIEDLETGTKTFKSKETDQSPLAIPEVQASMQDKLKDGNWMTGDLIKQISENPALLAKLQNPKYTKAMSEMQRDPKAAMARYQADADVMSFLREFMSLMGDHFTKLGEEEDAKAAAKAKAEQQAREREAIASAAAEAKAKDPEVARVLDDPELVRLLMDPGMKAVLQECAADPRKLQKHMSDPITGQFLRKLSAAGLIKFQ